MKDHFHINSKLNILILCLLLFLAYIITIIFNYAKKDKIFSYEVKSGSLAESTVYKGIILRDETIYYADQTGYIDYFAREGEHLGVGDLIYTIDESGVVNELIGEANGENKLSDEELNDLKHEIINFYSTFSKTEYGKTYDFLYSIDGMVLKYANMNILDTIGDVNKNSYSNLVKLNTASYPGYVVYNIDGYESLSVNSINDTLFDESTYNKDQLINNSLIDKNQPVYKQINSEEWSVVIQLSEEKALELSDAGYVEVKFLANQRKTWAKISTFQNGDSFYGLLTFNNSLVTFCTDRFIDIELDSTSKEGLKIPVTSLVYKEFFLIPVDYAIEKGEENNMFFLRKKFNEDGSIAAELINIPIYAEIDGFYYVDDSSLRLGDYLLTRESLSEYPVSTKGQLEGVYNMNNGFADFRQVNILYQNDEYAIVKSNTNYGLSEYDYIVLDSSAVGEDEIIFD